jgi:hypothetical protein
VVESVTWGLQEIGVAASSSARHREDFEAFLRWLSAVGGQVRMAVDAFGGYCAYQCWRAAFGVLKHAGLDLPWEPSAFTFPEAEPELEAVMKTAAPTSKAFQTGFWRVHGGAVARRAAAEGLRRSTPLVSGSSGTRTDADA